MTNADTPTDDLPDVRWIDDDAAFDDLLGELADVERFAVDTEFHRERSYYPRLALVQIAWGEGADHQIALVDPLALDFSGFRKILEGDALAIMHAAGQDLEVLSHACGTIPRRMFDTQLAAGFAGMSSPSLASLVDRFVGRRLPKGNRLTDWLTRPLGEAQRTYAASDVAYLIDLHDMLVDILTERGRVAWSEAECEVLRTRDRTAIEPESAWLRIKEARHLRGPARGVAREIAAWRERTAQRADQPVRFVLSDLALVSIAQRSPSSADDLDGIRGLDRRHLKEPNVSQLLEAVARGRRLDSDDIEPPNNQTRALDRSLRPAVTLVAAWVSQLARDEDLDPSLLATRADVEAFLRSDPSARLAVGWRNELLGEPIRRLVDGHAALAFEQGHGLVLERRSEP